MIFCHYVSSTSCYGAVHKLIIIRIFLNQIKIKVNGNKSCIRITYYCIYNVFGNLILSFPYPNYFNKACKS